MYSNWEKFNNKSKYEELVENIYNASKNDKLAFFIGAGVSINQGYPNWNGYVYYLLEYWKKRLKKEFINQNYIDASKILNNIRQINYINLSNYGNKRKTDLLYQIIINIKGYEWFKKHKLDFEKSFFVNDSKVVDKASLIYNLTKIDSIFITTNYDNEIERYLEYAHGKDNQCRDIEDIDYDDISVNTVIHIHGSPKGNPKHFMNSSTSYKDHYYKKNKFINKLRKFIDDRNLMMVFIGSSMEEDEVLSLVSSNENNTAIMRADSNSKYGNLLTTISEYNENNNKTSVFWFGNEFYELPIFINGLLNDVLDKSNEYTGRDYYDFLNERTPSNKAINIINNLKDNQLKIFFRKLDNSLIRIRTFNVINSESFKSGDLEIFSDFWELVYNISGSLTNAEKNNIINHIKNNNKSLNEYKCLKVVKSLDFNQQYLENWFNEISDYDCIMYTPFAKDSNTLAGYVLIKSILNSRIFDFSYECLKNRKINLTEKSFDLFLNALNYFNDINYYIKMYDLDSLMRIREVNLLYTLLKNNQLFIDNNYWYDSIKIEAFQNIIFIKILMKLYLDGDMSPFLKLKTIKNVDLNIGKLLGNGFKQFFNDNISYFRKFRDKEKDEGYTDYIFESGVVSYRSESYISIEDIYSETVVDKLKFIAKRSISKSLELEYSKDGTIEFIKGIFSRDNGGLKYRLLSVMQDSFDDIFEDYKMLYSYVLNNDFVPEEKIKYISELILNYYSIQKQLEYSSYDDQLFTYFFSKKEKQKAMNVFMKLPVINEKNNIIEFEEKNAFISFSNGSIGRYLLALKKICLRLKCLPIHFEDIISNFKDNRLKDIAHGYFDDIYVSKNIFNINSLVGKIRGSNEKNINALNYKDSIMEILQNPFSDEKVIEFVRKVSMDIIDPFDLKNNKIVDTNYFKFIKPIFFRKYNFKYEKNWLKYIIDNNMNFLQIYLRLLLNGDESEYDFRKYSSFVEIEIINAEFIILMNESFIKYFDHDDIPNQDINVNRHVSSLYYNLSINNKVENVDASTLTKVLTYLDNDKDKIKDLLNVFKEQIGIENYQSLYAKFIKY